MKAADINVGDILAYRRFKRGAVSKVEVLESPPLGHRLGSRVRVLEAAKGGFGIPKGEFVCENRLLVGPWAEVKRTQDVRGARASADVAITRAKGRAAEQYAEVLGRLDETLGVDDSNALDHAGYFASKGQRAERNLRRLAAASFHADQEVQDAIGVAIRHHHEIGELLEKQIAEIETQRDEELAALGIQSTQQEVPQ